MEIVASHNQALWDECAVKVIVEVLKTQPRYNYEVAADAAAKAADALVAQRQVRLP